MEKNKKKDLKWLFACGKPFYQKWWVWLTLLVVVLIPIIINKCYLFGNETGKGIVTLWGAKEAFTFYGSFLAFLGTVSLGSLALWQNKALSKVVERNDKANFVSFVNCVPEFDLSPPCCLFGWVLCFYDPENEMCNEEDIGNKNIEEAEVYNSGFCLTVKMENLSNHIVSKLSGNIYRGGNKLGNAERYYCNNFLLKPHETQEVTFSIKEIEGNQTSGSDFNDEGAANVAVMSEDEGIDYSLDINKLWYLVEENVEIKLEFSNVFGLKSFGTISFSDGLGAIDIEYSIGDFDLNLS